jgi:hypothetical protein
MLDETKIMSCEICGARIERISSEQKICKHCELYTGVVTEYKQ